MSGSLYSFPRGLVLVSPHGFYPKITSIKLPKSETGVMQELCHSQGEMLWGGCSPCCHPERQSNQDTSRKKAQSELLEILACPKDVLKWIPMGRALALVCFPVLPTPTDVKVDRLGSCTGTMFYSALTALSHIFCEENHRKGVLEGCSTDLMGMQVSPNSASGLARCVNNEPDLKLV